jgi:hypothetical protein
MIENSMRVCAVMLVIASVTHQHENKNCVDNLFLPEYQSIASCVAFSGAHC